jgi:hypothetical protein
VEAREEGIEGGHLVDEVYDGDSNLLSKIFIDDILKD